jgi:hypothetical protein
LDPNPKRLGSFTDRVDWALILVVAGVALTGSLAIAAALAAGASDRASDGTEAERAATWQAGYSPHELRVLAELAALVRGELEADSVEIVLRHGGEGVVVTGSRLPPGRLGQHVAMGDGVAGRALAGGRTTVAGLGVPDAEADEGLVAIAAPIPAGGGIVGVVAATASMLFGAADVARLEALAAQAGAELGLRGPDLRNAG